ncbi:MAG: hypothetical protein U1E13_02935, partial [Methylophilaceae bacterium]|nr:hypothetical protein [Methylophilaceae bacterium]
RAELFPQFHWSSIHALEKYAKCIAILTRTTKAKGIKHEVQKTLGALSDRVELDISDQTRKFICRLEEFGARFRYLEVSWFIKDCELAMLDRAVWELRRYCNPELYLYSENEFVSVNKNLHEKVKLIDNLTKQNTSVAGGFIEKILGNRQSRTRPDLVWRNLYYSNSNRKSVSIKTTMAFENAPFYLYPEIIDEVSKFTYIPNEISSAYKNSS